MKKIILVIVISLFLTGCGKTEVNRESKYENAVVFGTSLTGLISNSTINIVGTTSDSIESGIIEDVEDIGEMMNPNMEKVIELAPDVVILSDSYPNYDDIKTQLSDAGIEVLTLTYNSFSEYKDVVNQLANLTNDDTFYDKMVGDIEEEIGSYKSSASKGEEKTALIVRTSATALKVVDNSYFSNEIIEDMNIVNIANTNSNISVDLSIEYIVEEDPDYIFVIPMGDASTSNEGLNNYIGVNDAWGSLTAVKSKNVYNLPKDLFHNKPNERWNESYEYIYEIINK